MFRTRKRVAIGLGVLGLVLISLFVVGTALADDPPPTATPTQKTSYQQVFIEKLAAALGVDAATLKAKIKEAAKGTVDQAVTNGDLAKNPAEKIKEAIDQGRVPFIGGFDRLRGRAPKVVAPIAQAKALVAGVADRAIAEKLGLTPGELRQQLRAGKSLEDLAKAKGLTVQDLYNAAADAVKARLDTAVQNGRITQAQADEVVQAVREGRLIGLDILPKGLPRVAPKATATPTKS